MNKRSWIWAIVIVLIVILSFVKIAHSPKTDDEDFKNNLEKNMALQISSPQFEDGGNIPSKYTCDGDNTNPEFNMNGVPEGAISLALIMDDPDVPTNLREDGMWDHWIVFNIPPQTTKVDENSEPEGVHGSGTAGNANYRGPCPPDREHRYFFKLYALDTMLDLPEGVSKKEVEDAMKGHIIEQAELVGKYNKK